MTTNVFLRVEQTAKPRIANGRARLDAAQRETWRRGLAIAAVALAAGLSAGCAHDDCLTDPLACPGAFDSSDGIPPQCIPSDENGVLDDRCGLFVAAATGDDTNGGTKEKPLATLTRAIALANGRPVYACAGAKPFNEAIFVQGDANLFGGLDCATWEHAPETKTKWTAGADEVPLLAGIDANVAANDMVIEAADAVKAGGSSIVVLAVAAKIHLTRCEVIAGNAAAGADGAAVDMSAMVGSDGLAGADACTGAVTIGGLSAASTCSDEESLSGLGGVGTEASGGSGSPGLPEGAMNGGSGEGASACTNGTTGDTGNSGKPGTGSVWLGSIYGQGFMGYGGNDGQVGHIGQGAGGGGGAKGGSGNGTGVQKYECGKVAGAGGNAGASGGSGGAGGCGGAGGKGGGAGGASIGIASISAKLTFKKVTITTRDGGKGGDGGAGQAGGPGGMGGEGGKVPAAASSLQPGCAGGQGGTGGAGGRGGGGAGGPSVGIAYSGDAPGSSGAMIETGSAGHGGVGDGPEGNGIAGVSEKVYAL